MRKLNLFSRWSTDGTAVDLHIGSLKIASILQALITQARPMGSESFVHDGVTYSVLIHDKPAPVVENPHVQIDDVLDPLAKGR